MKDLRTIQLEHNTLEESLIREMGISSSQRSEFLIPAVSATATITAIDFKDDDFEHVLLNPKNRLPTYEEMANLKDIFWNQNEVTIQVHPSKSDYINIENYTLHLWRHRCISASAERKLIERIKQTYAKAISNYYSHEKKVIFEDNKLIVFGGDKWPSWDEICILKQKYWEPEEAAVQFNLGKDIDLNPEHCIVLWDASDMILPKKEFV